MIKIKSMRILKDDDGIARTVAIYDAKKPDGPWFDPFGGLFTAVQQEAFTQVANGKIMHPHLFLIVEF